MLQHIWMSIEGLERRLLEFKSYSWKNNYCKSAFWITYGNVTKSLERYKDKWYTTIPASGCNNLRDDWTCWWHKNK